MVDGRNHRLFMDFINFIVFCIIGGTGLPPSVEKQNNVLSEDEGARMGVLTIKVYYHRGNTILVFLVVNQDGIS